VRAHIADAEVVRQDHHDIREFRECAETEGEQPKQDAHGRWKPATSPSCKVDSSDLRVAEAQKQIPELKARVPQLEAEGAKTKAEAEKGVTTLAKEVEAAKAQFEKLRAQYEAVKSTPARSAGAATTAPAKI